MGPRPDSRTDLRRSAHAVSPVVGTILLVAMTVILAATLYVALSGVLAPIPSGPQAMGVAIARSTDGTNWTLTVVWAPPGLSPDVVRLSVVSLTGDLVLTKALADIAYGADGAAYVPSDGAGIGAGDRVLLDASRYPRNFDVVISDATAVLFRGYLV
ncbi:MAG: archaellin/type IV pilin N-terminal domain-containing protein [Methanobacteriota archaeon]